MPHDSSDKSLIFQESPVVELATNKFVNVPIIFQFDETPLIEVMREVQAGFTTKFSIYHSDGTYLAKVVGSSLFTTADGDKAGLVLRHPQGMTVCEMAGQTLFELQRQGAAALKTTAELYTPSGVFVRANDAELSGKIVKTKKMLVAGGVSMSGCTFNDFRIGILMTSKGSTAIGVNDPKL